LIDFKETKNDKDLSFAYIKMEPVGVEPTSKHLPAYLSTTIGYVLL